MKTLSLSQTPKLQTLQVSSHACQILPLCSLQHLLPFHSHLKLGHSFFTCDTKSLPDPSGRPISEMSKSNFLLEFAKSIASAQDAAVLTTWPIFFINLSIIINVGLLSSTTNISRDLRGLPIAVLVSTGSSSLGNTFGNRKENVDPLPVPYSN